MIYYDEEFNRLIAVERYLVNVSGQLSTAERLLGGPGLVRDNVRQTLETLAEALELTRKAKKVMLNEWRLSTASAA
jgi:hypothetical protein